MGLKIDLEDSVVGNWPHNFIPERRLHFHVALHPQDFTFPALSVTTAGEVVVA